MSCHKTVKVKAGKQEDEIDELIAPLVEQLWHAGLWTGHCCQEWEPGVVRIGFLSFEDGKVFLDIAAQYEEAADSIYSRIARKGDHPYEAAWRFDIDVDDIALERECDSAGNVVEESHDGEVHLSEWFSIEFPQTDLPTLVDRMTAFNQTRIKHPNDSGDVKYITDPADRLSESFIESLAKRYEGVAPIVTSWDDHCARYSDMCDLVIQLLWPESYGVTPQCRHRHTSAPARAIARLIFETAGIYAAGDIDRGQAEMREVAPDPMKSEIEYEIRKALKALPPDADKITKIEAEMDAMAKLRNKYLGLAKYLENDRIGS